MTTFEIIATILSSSLLSAGLTGFITWKVKQSEFKKTIFVNFINRRINAYAELENLIGTLSMMLTDVDGGKYNLVFSEKDMWGEFLLHILTPLKFNTWYSTEVIKILVEINNLQDVIGILKYDNAECIKENIKIGKENYLRIRLLKEGLTNQIREDYKTLHITDFKTFFGATKR